MADITLRFTETGGKEKEIRMKFTTDPQPSIFELVQLALRANNIYRFTMDVYPDEKSQLK